MEWKHKENQEWPNDMPIRIKREAMRFRLRMIFIMAIVAIIMCLISGCITKRGNSIGGGYIKGPDGVYRKPKIEQFSAPLPPVEIASPHQSSRPIELKPAKTRPTIPKGNSAIANPTPIEAKSSPATLPPLSPTVFSANEINLGLIKITLPEREDSTEIVINNPQVVAGPSKIPPQRDYSRLFAYYFFCSLFLLIGLLAYRYRNGKEANDRRRKTKN